MKIPVFVAGGVYTGYDVKNLLIWRSRQQIATRFIATHECDASLAYKERYLNVKPEDIVLIKSTVGMPGRALRSPFVELTARRERKITRCLVCLRPCTRKWQPSVPHSATEAAKAIGKMDCFSAAATFTA
ncbi:MAG: nitronate monooxygenase [Acutalibacteraceae bacterium]